MANNVKKQVLDVYLQGQLVGELVSENAALTFTYATAYLQKQDARKLSVSLPLQAEGFDHPVTAAFFSGLLPDEGVRQTLAKYLHISEKNTFALLKTIGGECAGAVSVYPEGISPHLEQTPTYRVLTENEADEVLSSLNKHPLLAGEVGIRISGAGAQDKLMIAFSNGHIAIPTGSTPSTHIIKPRINGLEDSVHNEFFCMRLAEAISLPVPKVNIFWLKDKPYYLTERYDRRIEKNGTVTRLHQEDFCQAMHIAPEIKYENEGGPTLKQCFGLLDERIHSAAMAGKNKLTLLQGVIFNFLIGNSDAHGKNFSILYQEESESLAPFYDLLCTVIYDNNAYKTKMAMKIGSKYKFREITERDWDKLSNGLGLRPDFVRRQIMATHKEMANAAALLCDEFNRDPHTASPIYKKIMAVIANNYQNIMV